jgi:hypothetical protein
MSRMRKHLWLLTSFCLAASCAAQAPSEYVNPTHDLCPADSSYVSEVPAGRTDGFNRLFTLSSEPISKSHFRAFDNGIDESIGKDVELNGKALTFPAEHAPLPGDVLNTFYCERVVATQTTPAIDPGAVPLSMNRSSTGSFSSQLLRNALESELSQSRVVARAPVASEPSVRRVFATRSLQMLSRRMAASETATSRGTKHAKSQSDRVAQGVEGIGDQDLPSAYDELGDPDSYLSGLVRPRSIASTQNPRSEEVSDTAPSLKMLVRSLRASRKNDSGNK